MYGVSEPAVPASRLEEAAEAYEAMAAVTVNRRVRALASAVSEHLRELVAEARETPPPSS